MAVIRDESLMRAAFAPARNLEPSDADIARVLARARKPTGRSAFRFANGRRRLLAPALAALVLLAGGAYAVPPTRAALGDLADTFSGWLSGDDSSAPGRPLGANEDAPAYFHNPRYGRDARVIAEADGYKLYASMQADGSVSFDLGNTGVGLGFEPSSFIDRALYVLGPGSVQNADEHGHVPLFGVTARSVRSVELVYESGPPLRAEASDGGFVLLAEPPRAPHEVVAYDARGEVVARELVDDSDHYGPRIDWQQYGPPAPRVPSSCQPGIAGPNPPPPCQPAR
jgi:hypothetical protein